MGGFAHDDGTGDGSGGNLASFFEASSEHRPMSGLDEFMIHNHPHPVRVMWTGDSQAYERIWLTAQDQVGQLIVVAGMGMYPNLGTAEAFAIVTAGVATPTYAPIAAWARTAWT